MEKRYRNLSMIAVLFFLTTIILVSCGGSYSVTYDLNYNGKTEVKQVDKGYISEPEHPERYGYIFIGWYVSDCKWNFESDILSENITLTAKWEPISTVVTLDLAGGECAVDSLILHYGEEYELPTPTREGYYFAGWYHKMFNVTNDSIWYQAEDTFILATWSRVPLGMMAFFGRYEQDNNLDNGAEDIEWYVIDYVDGRYLLLSKYILEPMEFESSNRKVGWKECSLRSWVLNEFIGKAFTAAELSGIAENYYEETGTYDKVFLLSHEEIRSIYDYAIGKGLGSEYARANGLVTGNGPVTNPINSWWWIRTSVIDKSNLADGWSLSSGNRGLYGFRPAIWVDEDVLFSK